MEAFFYFFSLFYFLIPDFCLQSIPLELLNSDSCAQKPHLCKDTLRGSINQNANTFYLGISRLENDNC